MATTSQTTVSRWKVSSVVNIAASCLLVVVVTAALFVDWTPAPTVERESAVLPCRPPLCLLQRWQHFRNLGEQYRGRRLENPRQVKPKDYYVGSVAPENFVATSEEVSRYIAPQGTPCVTPHYAEMRVRHNGADAKTLAAFVELVKRCEPGVEVVIVD
jgi:hypothetical protein